MLQIAHIRSSTTERTETMQQNHMKPPSGGSLSHAFVPGSYTLPPTKVNGENARQQQLAASLKLTEIAETHKRRQQSAAQMQAAPIPRPKPTPIPKPKQETHKTEAAVLEAALRALGLAPEARSKAIGILMTHFNNRAAAGRFLKQLTEDGWSSWHIRYLLFERSVIFRQTTRQIRGTHALLAGYAHCKTFAADMMLQHPFLCTIGETELQKRINAAVGYVSTIPVQPLRLLLTFAPNALKLESESLLHQRNGLLNRNFDPNLHPELLLKTEGTITILHDSDQHPYPAFREAGWSMEETDVHLNAFPSIRRIQGEFLHEALLHLKETLLPLPGQQITAILQEQLRAFVERRDAVRYWDWEHGTRLPGVPRLTKGRITWQVRELAHSIHCLSYPTHEIEDAGKTIADEITMMLEEMSVPLAVLCEHPELLVEQARPIHTAYGIFKKFLGHQSSNSSYYMHLNLVGHAKRNAGSKHKKQVITDRVDTIGQLILFYDPEYIANTINVQRNVVAECASTNYSAKLMDPCCDWNRLLIPSLRDEEDTEPPEFLMRIAMLKEVGINPLHIPEILPLLYSPSRESLRLFLMRFTELDRVIHTLQSERPSSEKAPVSDEPEDAEASEDASDPRTF